jgi:hypothetical protein
LFAIDNDIKCYISYIKEFAGKRKAITTGMDLEATLQNARAAMQGNVVEAKGNRGSYFPYLEK